MATLSNETLIRKVAIQKEEFFPQLYILKQNVPLPNVVREICGKWNLLRPEQYALQYLDSKVYITPENRHEIHDGAILTVGLTPELAAAKFLADIEQPELQVKRSALQALAGGGDGESAGQADDPTFAKEFLKRNGVVALVKIVENQVDPIDVITGALASIQELLEHGFVSWDNQITQKFIKKVMHYVNKGENVEPKLLQKSLSLLESVVTTSATMFVLVLNDLGNEKLENVVLHVNSPHQEVSSSAVALCNAMYAKTQITLRPTFANNLKAKGYQKALNRIITNSHTVPLSNEMAHQFYVYQSLTLSLYEPRIAPPDFNDPRLFSELNSIYSVAFDSTPMVKMAGQDKAGTKPDFKKLGFVNRASPLVDLEECPPGILAADVMLYFAKKHQDQYIKIILENFGRDEEYECPFGRCSKQLTKMLIEVLHIGETISDTSEDFQPIFFSGDCIFEELYCVAIQLLNKTWKEMRATSRDFLRVVGVVKDQVKRVLIEKPETIEKFKTKAFSLPYQQILRLMQQEAQERNILDSQTKPVIELRDQITPEIRELVRQQRLGQLVEGQWFNHFSTRGRQKDKFWFCRLSTNHRFLHYGDAEEGQTPQLEMLPNKVPLSEVTEIKIGKDTPHIKEARFKKGHASLAFSVFYNQEEHLDFIAPSQEVFSAWTDALLSLTGKEMKSQEFQNDMDMLLNMEMKLLLLDLENVRIPETAPPIPPEPENYDFYYHDD